MRCPKCNSRIDNMLEYCNYCGEKVKSNNRDDQYEYSKNYSNIKSEYTANHSEQYGYSKTYSGTTKEYDTPHADQYDYSKTYSDTTKEYDTPHAEQYDYSKTYSGTTKEYDTPHADQYNYSQQYSNYDLSNITSDVDYIKAYVGESTYKDITNPKISFSIGAFIFGPAYLLYRKLWLPAIISIILLVIISIGIHDVITPLIIINCIIAKLSNRLLLDKANKSVEKIKNKNPDKDSRELLELCRKEGEPTKIGHIIFIILFISLLTSFLIAMYINIE